MKSYLVKRKKKYIIATLNSPTTYLKSLGQEEGFVFTDNIECASKTLSKEVANYLINCFYQENNNIEIELVVLPIYISYEIINELE